MVSPRAVTFIRLYNWSDQGQSSLSQSNWPWYIDDCNDVATGDGQNTSSCKAEARVCFQRSVLLNVRCSFRLKKGW